MKLGYVALAGRGETDAFLAGLAQHMQTRGLRLAGTVQINIDRDCGHLCDMDLMLLPDGPVVRISQDLGAGSTGCRLDAGALETAVALSRDRLAGADLLIVNKFGKHEAEGRGFRELIAEALSRGLPVLTGVNSQNLAAFQTFSDRAAERLSPDIDSVLTWTLAAAATA